MKALYPKKIFKDNSISNDAKIVYAYVVALCNSCPLDHISVVPDNIVQYTYGRLDRAYVKKLMHSLCEAGYIKYDEYGRIIKDSVKVGSKSFYFQYDTDNIDTILKSKYRLGLCYYYLAILSTRNSKYGTSNMTAKYFSQIMDIDEKTIYKYNGYLESLGVLTIEHMKNRTANIYHLT